MSLKHIVVLEGHTEKELLIATQELRQRAKRDGIRASISAARLAALMEKTGANEALLRQRLRDLEGKKVLAIIAGQSGHPQTLGGNGQISRRCLPVHFPRYQLQREEDCIEFQAALLALLQKVPLNCDAETFVRSYWLYFYECSIGCIGVLKDWLLRVS